MMGFLRRGGWSFPRAHGRTLCSLHLSPDPLATWLFTDLENMHEGVPRRKNGNLHFLLIRKVLKRMATLLSQPEEPIPLSRWDVFVRAEE